MVCALIGVEAVIVTVQVPDTNVHGLPVIPSLPDELTVAVPDGVVCVPLSLSVTVTVAVVD